MARTQDIQWKNGQFHSFRVVLDVALPEIDGVPQQGLRKDEVIQYDGLTLKRNGEQDRPLPQLKTCVGKWIVPADDMESEYVPKPAGVKVHSPTQQGNDPRQEGETLAIASEDMVDVGTIGQRIEGRKASGNKVAARAATQAKRTKAQAQMSPLARKLTREMDLLAGELGLGQEAEPEPEPEPEQESFTASDPEPPRKRFAVETREQADLGPAIGRVKRSEDTADVEVGNGNGESIRNTEVVVDSGPKRFAGADALSNEVEVGTKTASRKSAKAGKRDMEVEGGDQGGVAVASLGKPSMRTEITDGSKAAREASRLDSMTMGKRTKFTVTAAPEEEDEVVGSVGEDQDETEGEVVEAEAAKPAIPEDFAAKLASAKMFVPKFDWDIARDWEERVKDALENYVKKPNWMRAILAVETPDVQRSIRTKLKKLGVEL